MEIKIDISLEELSYLADKADALQDAFHKELAKYEKTISQSIVDNVPMDILQMLQEYAEIDNADHSDLFSELRDRIWIKRKGK